MNTSRSSSPGRSALRPSPVTKSGTAMSRLPPPGATRRSIPSSDAANAVIGPAGSDRQMLPPTVATLCTLNEPSSASQLWRASAAEGAAWWRAGCQRASSARVQVAATRRPSPVSSSGLQPSAARSSSRRTAGWGWENSQVPPPSQASPSRQAVALAGVNSVTVLRSTR